MARPTLLHDGFLIPNAGDVSNPRMAEPDRIDFNTLAHDRWGVVEGCLVTVSVSTAIISAGVALVNGAMVSVAGASLPIPTSQALDRFDLIVVNASGAVLLVGGTSGADPVFPDPGISVTVLAAVFVPTAVSDLSSNVIDKRKFVSNGLLTKINPSLPLIQNLNNVGDHFRVTGGGVITWEGDTTLSRTSIGTLTLDGALNVLDGIVTNSVFASATLTATGRVQGANLASGPSLPGSAANGSIFQNETDGRIYVRKAGAWAELATVNGTVPTGTIIDSVEIPDVMIPRGWVPLDGRTISEATYLSLFNLTQLAGYINGVSPNRTMTLPNANGRVRMTAQSGIGNLGGPTSNQRSLTVDNLPRHRHNVAMSPAGSGTFKVRVLSAGDHSHSMQAGGLHQHQLFAPTGDINIQGPTVIFPKGQYVPPFGQVPGMTAGQEDSQHTHTILSGGAHEHQAYTDPLPDHTHAITEQDVGVGAAFDVTPSYLAVFTYIRS